MIYKFYKYAAALALLSALPLFLIGCGGGGGGVGGGETPAPTFSITGKISLADGTSVNGVAVNLYKTSYQIFTIPNTSLVSTRNSSGIETTTLDPAPLQSATTNAQGIYSFPGVRSEKYTIVPTSSTYVFKWSLVPTRSTIGVLAITESGMVYTYNPEGSGNQLSADGTIIFNTGTPFSIANNTLSGQDFEASLPGGGTGI